MDATLRSIRPGTRLAASIDAMPHPGGTTIARMMAGTGWRAQNIRGAISGLVRKRLAYQVVTDKRMDGQRACGIACTADFTLSDRSFPVIVTDGVMLNEQAAMMPRPVTLIVKRRSRIC
mgnify:CR=1 FL=1